MSVNLTPEEIDELKEENRNLRSEVKRLFSESRKLLRERDYGRMMSERSKLTFQAKDKLSQLVFTEKSRLEKYMNMLLDNTPDIVMFFDENGRIVFVSSAYLRRSNIAAIGLIYGKSLDDMLKPVVSEEFLSHVDEMFRRAMEEKLTTEAEQEIDFGLDGRLRSYQIQMTPMLEDGEVKGSIVTFYDMTEVKQAQRDAEHARELAEQSTRAKSDFLSRMSHEIRTPMNAISGMSELLLRRDLDEDSKGYARDIKQASANLMSLINDLLDISKIEAGRLEIIPVTYYPSSLINDVVNIIRMRLAEKPIRFYTNIDAAIPGMMIGDEVRLRQILLNMLNNAAKYTEKGFVSLTITRDEAEGDMVTLRIVVADSGVGIKPEDQQKLFGEFIQVDTKRNRGIEGTGLGLAITKRLCAAMGGDISVESEYGRGSVFTACIPQRTASEAPFASVENLGGKKTLVYERRMVYAKSIAWSLENMGVPHRLTSDIESFARALREEEWYFVFSGYGLYDRIMPVMELAERECPEKKRPHLALMVEWGSEKYIPNARFVSLPLQTLSISDVLNGAPVRRDCMESALFTGTRFTAPGTRLLVVDDIATNLKVAEGLIAPYKADVDACLSGAEAVELVKRNRYDIVFMDHMMPDMDGVEAALLIREWEKGHGCADGRPPVPIIALTANAVSGMREMFIEAGFNDFLAKPIDVSKLDEIIEKWLPREKQIKADGGPLSKAKDRDVSVRLEIPGIDVRRGIIMTGGSEALYRQVLSTFRHDAGERLPLLQTPPEEMDMHLFITQVHALKSASANIGAAEVSAEAARLETAGRNGDMAFIEDALPMFAIRIAKLIEIIEAALAAGADAKTSAEPAPDADYYPLLRELAAALEAENTRAIDRLLEDLNQRTLDAKTRESLEQISDRVLMAEFGAALEIIAGMTGGNDLRPSPIPTV